MPPTGQPDFSRMDNEKLEELLKSSGVNYGPINAATRRTYERRLAKLMTGVISPPQRNYQPVDDDSYDEEEEAEDVKQQRRKHTPLSYDGSDYKSVCDTFSHSDSYTRINQATEIQGKYPRPAPIISEPPQPRVRPLREAQLYSEKRNWPSSSDSKTTFSYSTPASRFNTRVMLHEDSRDIPIWLKLIALGMAFTLIYLIYANMESQAVSNIPEAQDKMEV